MTTKTTTKAKAEPAVTSADADQTAATRPEPRDVTVYDAVGRTPGITIAEIATAIGWGRSTVTKSLARMTKQGTVTRTKGGHDGTKRLPDTFVRTADAKPADKPTAKPEKPAKHKTGKKPSQHKAPGAEQDSKLGERLGKGELGDLVARLLADHPKVEFGPSQVAKELDRSAGAIANALDKMAKGGTVELVQAKPKRYKLKATT